MYMDSQSPSLLAWCPFTSTLGVPGLFALPVAVAELARLAGRGGSGPSQKKLINCWASLIDGLFTVLYIHALLILFILFA
ncbi:hypothetical protein Syun_015440 [Stephania yunnanensis]|uniref:Uncharacterized protein n=1 Tax=Stephania yunnanensis TaxID=152371 RepID=A0AAP0JNE0_9MAGN